MKLYIDFVSDMEGASHSHALMFIAKDLYGLE